MPQRTVRNATGGGQNLFQLMDVFSGGAFAQMTIIALGVMPYISASIIMQLVVALVPSMQREIRENPDVGRRKMGKWIRMLTVALAFFQSGLFANMPCSLMPAVRESSQRRSSTSQLSACLGSFILIVMATMTAGTVLADVDW